MNTFEPKQQKPQLETHEGWLVQVYGSNRRLLCVLDASHGWIGLIGFGLGFLLAVLSMGADSYSPPRTVTPPTELPALQVD